MVVTAARLGDVRQIHDADDESVLGAFDALVPGDSLVVIGDHEPRDILRRLQAARKGFFEWSPLECPGPEELDALVARIQAS